MKLVNAFRVWWVIRKLGSRSTYPRDKAVTTLVACGNAAIEPLLSALSQFHPQELSDKYLPCFSGSNLQVSGMLGRENYERLRHCAAEALGKIGDPRAIDPLQKVISSTYRKMACSSLRSYPGEPFNETESEPIVHAAECSLESLQQKSPKIDVSPGQYFSARGSNVPLIYGQCLERLTPDTISARCYSRMCPSGENGNFAVQRIINVIDKSEFDAAVRNL